MLAKACILVVTSSSDTLTVPDLRHLCLRWKHTTDKILLDFPLSPRFRSKLFKVHSEAHDVHKQVISGDSE